MGQHAPTDPDSDDDVRMPHAVVRLMQGPIATITHVEALLALHAAAPATRSLGDLGGATRVSSGAVVCRCVRDLEDAGLITPHCDGTTTYVYAPKTLKLRARVDALAELYRAHPAVLKRALYRRVDHGRAPSAP